MPTALLISTLDCPAFARDAAAGLRPTPDYRALARVLNAVVMDREAARRGLSAPLRAAAAKIGPDVAQALLAFRRRREFDRFVCDSEGIGLPLAALLRAARRPQPVHFIGHRMTARSKEWLWRGARLRPQVGGVFCYADTQAEFLRGLRLAPERIHRMPFHADHRFFRPEPYRPTRVIAAVGQERRDYPTLITAMKGLDCEARILAASPWARCRDTSREVEKPANVHFVAPRRCGHCGSPHPDEGLRAMYAGAAIVAVPVQATDFQAGITSLLEGMAMGRPVVATGNPSLRELFPDGEAGLWVPPGDVKAMASALGYLLEHPREAEEMGRRGRILIENGMALDHWVARIAGAVAA